MMKLFPEVARVNQRGRSVLSIKLVDLGLFTRENYLTRSFSSCCQQRILRTQRIYTGLLPSWKSFSIGRCCNSVEQPNFRSMSTERQPVNSVEKLNEGGHDSQATNCSNDGFSSLGLSQKLVRKLSEVSGIRKPLEIQSLAIPSILKYRNLIVQSETGSGKTLAYLLPAIQQAKYPCCTMIIVPTRELAYQIYIEARKLTDRKDVACYVSRQGIESEFQKLKQYPPKIIIGTPKQLLAVVLDHEFLFSNIKRVITDEIDKMMPPVPFFNKQLLRKREKNPKPIVKLLAVLQGIAKGKLQFIASSATINQKMIENLKDNGWGYQLKVIKPKTYDETQRIVPGCIKHNYVLVQDNSIDSKVAVVSKVFSRFGQKAALVFIHREHNLNIYVDTMRNLHLNAVAFYKQVVTGDTGEIIRFLEDFRTGKISVVVASEEEVRGLDFRELDHVYLFDIPRTADEYLHMAGRVGRLGRNGTVITVISELHEFGFKRLQRMYGELGVTAKEIIV